MNRLLVFALVLAACHDYAPGPGSDTVGPPDILGLSAQDAGPADAGPRCPPGYCLDLLLDLCVSADGFGPPEPGTCNYDLTLPWGLLTCTAGKCASRAGQPTCRGECA